MDRVEGEGEPLADVDLYAALKAATLVWLQTEAGVWIGPDEDASTAHADSATEVAARHSSHLEGLEYDVEVLPYGTRILDALRGLPLKRAEVVFGNYGISSEPPHRPLLLELIWSYWHEEGLLVQTMDAVGRRLLNCHAPGGRHDSLSRLKFDPTQPVERVVSDYLQDEWSSLGKRRRAYEYEHEYGLSLSGKALPGAGAGAGARFPAALGDLFAACSSFYEADDDATTAAALLDALKDVQSILAASGHNQGDVAWAARSEMLIQQWILGSPKLGPFFGDDAMESGRARWIDRVDMVRRLQGWGRTSVTHAHDLAVLGEQLLLSIRHGTWGSAGDSSVAAAWARYWRPEIQAYVHASRAVTGPGAA